MPAAGRVRRAGNVARDECRNCRRYVGYRCDGAGLVADGAIMPRYSFTLEDGFPLSAPDATEDFVGDDAAMDHARKVARDFDHSTTAQGKSGVVVRDATGREVGRAPLLNVMR